MDPQKEPMTPADNNQPATDTNATEGNTLPAENTMKPEAQPAPAVTPSSVVTPGAGSPPAFAGQSTTPASPSWPAGESTPGVPAGSLAPKPKKKGLLIGLVIALVVLVLGGGAAAAYFTVIVPNKPENVLNAALANSFSDKITSEKIKGDMTVTDKASKQTFGGDFTVAANNQGALDMNMDLDVAVTKANLQIRSVDGKDFYMKVGGLEGLPELLGATGDETAGMYSSIIAGVNNQWIEVTQSMISTLTGGQTTNLKLSDADRAKLKQAYTDHQFLTVKESLASEKISGKDSYHYKVAIDKQQLKDFMAAVKDAKLESVKVTQDELNSFNDAIKNVDFSKYPAEVWISKDQKFIDQIKFKYEDKDASLALTSTVTDFNVPVTVTKPSGAKSLLQIMSGLFGGSLSGTGTGTGDTQLLEGLEGSGISL